MTIHRESASAAQVEEPIDSDMPICDPHHHLWDHPDNCYLAEQFLQDAEGGHRIVQTVFVECSANYRETGPEAMRPVGETEFVERIASECARRPNGKAVVAAGIVGFADLRLGAAVAPVLEAHIVAGRGRFRGIRQASAWHPSPDVGTYRSPPEGLLRERTFRDGFAKLAGLGLSFDAFLYHPQLPELADLAKAFPQTSIILNHAGTPLGIGPYASQHDEVFRDWQRGIETVAASPNVTVKLGGFGMRVCGYEWHMRSQPMTSEALAKTIGPYVLFCIEAFGPDRCMFESNFPVDKPSYAYTVLWNTFKRIAHGFSPGERAALFQKTALRVYRLAPAG